MLNDHVIRATELMDRNVITVTPDTPVLALHRLFVEQDLPGAPVVGDGGTVQGVVSTLDLLRIVRNELESGAQMTTTYYQDELPYSDPDWVRMPDYFRARMQRITAADAMSREIVMIHPEATLDEIVQILSERRLHRVLVGQRGVLQGTITTFDLLPVLSRIALPHPRSIRHTGYSRGDFES